jgi:enamine deaminase RidA (YjgF/YER057c/UK114 family)
MQLPIPRPPAGAYQSVVIRGGIGAVSGQFPSLDGKLVLPGRVGAELTEEQGFKAAQLAALNILSQIAAALNGFDRLGGLIRLDGHVASVPGYVMQPRVLDGASQLLTAALGSKLGAHTRTAYSAEQLPLGSCIELSVLFAVDETAWNTRPWSDSRSSVQSPNGIFP